jgi:hypothetical protein
LHTVHMRAEDDVHACPGLRQTRLIHHLIRGNGYGVTEK